jgi:hypothetical protein
MRRRRYFWSEYLRYAWMIHYATILLCAWGIMLLVSNDPFGSTPVSALRFGHRFIAAPILFGAAALAVRGVRLRGTRTGWLFMLPQQLLLIISAVAGIAAIVSGHYADLEPRPRFFIAADQMPGIVAAFCHTFAIIDLHRASRTWKRAGLTLH